MLRETTLFMCAPSCLRDSVAVVKAAKSCAWALAIVTAALAASSEAQQMPLDNLREQERQSLIERHRALLAPAPLPPETFLAWSEEAGLDEAQRQALSETIAAYAQRLPALEKDLRAKILELWPASFEFDRDARAVAAILSPTLLELYDLHSRLIQRVLDMERPIVASIIAPLAPANQAMVESSWLARLRRLRGLSEPAAAIHALDPAAMLSRMTIEEADSAQLEPVIAEYRRQMIRTLEGSDTLAPLEAEAIAAAMLLELGPAWELFFEPREVAEIEDDLRASRKRPMLDRVAELNHQFIRDAADLLPARQSIELRSLYFQYLLPEFFEEEREMLALADRIAALVADLEGDAGIAARDALDRTLRVTAEELDATAEAGLALDAATRTTTIPFASSTLSEVTIRDAVSRLERERDLLDVRRERRRVIDRAIGSLQAIAQHGPDYQSLRETFEQFRRIQKARDEADEFRHHTLGERIAGLAALQRERESERDRE